MKDPLQRKFMLAYLPDPCYNNQVFIIETMTGFQ